MKKKSDKKNQGELAVDQWLQDLDLSKDMSPEDFKSVRFAKLEKKLVEDSYEKSTESQPVTLRLPKELILKLKLAAQKKGLAYQTYARLLLQQQVNKALS